MHSEAVTQLIDRYESIVRENERLILEITKLQAEHNCMLLKYKAFFHPENQGYIDLFAKVIQTHSREERKVTCEKIRSLLSKNESSLIERIKIVRNITGMTLSNSKRFIEGYDEVAFNNQ